MADPVNFTLLFKNLNEASQAEAEAKALKERAMAALLAEAQRAAEEVMRNARTMEWMHYIPDRIVVTYNESFLRVTFYDLHDRNGMKTPSKAFYFGPKGLDEFSALLQQTHPLNGIYWNVGVDSRYWISEDDD